MGQKFHTFSATTLDEAYDKMRRTLGEEAVVLRTATVRDAGIMGILGRTHVEVTASAPETLRSAAGRPLSNVERAYQSHSRVGSPEKTEETLAYFKQLVADAQKRMGQNPSGGPAAAPVIPFQKRPPEQTETDIRKDLQELRDMLQVIMAESPGAALPPEFADHYRMLLDKGVSRKVAAALVNDVVNGSDAAVLRDERVFLERLRLQVRRRVETTGGISLTGGECKFVALVGATGVGKTTNLAKLASNFAVRERAKVAFVTADTYRVAAVEQLRVYANIIGLELRVVNDPSEMAEARKEFKDYDLILMDTAGGSQFNVKQIAELKDILDTAQPDEVMLVVEANTALEDSRQVVANFGVLNPTALLFSKLDETRRYGPMFTLIDEVDLPLSYFSVGQNVPDDLVLAQAGMVANLLLEGKDKGGRSSTETS